MIVVIMLSVFIATFIYYGYIVENIDIKKQLKEERKKQLYYTRKNNKK